MLGDRAVLDPLSAPARVVALSFAGRPESFRYQVDSNRLTCLGLWGISIGRYKVGLIEASVGDLGRDLPSVPLLAWLDGCRFPASPAAQGVAGCNCRRAG